MVHRSFDCCSFTLKNYIYCRSLRLLLHPMLFNIPYVMWNHILTSLSISMLYYINFAHSWQYAKYICLCNTIFHRHDMYNLYLKQNFSWLGHFTKYQLGFLSSTLHQGKIVKNVDKCEVRQSHSPRQRTSEHLFVHFWNLTMTLTYILTTCARCNHIIVGWT